MYEYMSVLGTADDAHDHTLLSSDLSVTLCNFLPTRLLSFSLSLLETWRLIRCHRQICSQWVQLSGNSSGGRLSDNGSSIRCPTA
jgi:hypothetical protein